MSWTHQKDTDPTGAFGKSWGRSETLCVFVFWGSQKLVAIPSIFKLFTGKMVGLLGWWDHVAACKASASLQAASTSRPLSPLTYGNPETKRIPHRWLTAVRCSSFP